MMRPIPLKMTTVNLTTGEESTSTAQAFVMTANPKPGECAECLKAHAPTEPHDALSISYQYAFFAQHERFPDWRDAMAHCPDDVRQSWTEGLTEMGVDVAAGRLLPGVAEVCETETFTDEEVSIGVGVSRAQDAKVTIELARSAEALAATIELDLEDEAALEKHEAELAATMIDPDDAELDAKIGREDDAYWSKHGEEG